MCVRFVLQSIFFRVVESTLTLIRSAAPPDSSQRNPKTFNYAAPGRSTTEPLEVHEHITWILLPTIQLLFAGKIYAYWDLHVLNMLKRHLMYIRTSCAAAP